VDGRGVDRPPYVAALRLYAIAEERWAEIEARYLSVDLLRLPSAKFLNAVYAWCVKYMSPEDREKWDMMLTAPLPGQVRRPTDAEVEAEGEAFLAAMSAHQTLTGKG
jgi:hypothetical protein